MEKSEADAEFASRVFDNMMETFFNPEIIRRKQLQLLPEDFELRAAQAILYPDGRTRTIRLNQEVAAEIKLKKGVDSSADDFWPTTDQVEEIKLHEKELLNCGHATIVLFKNGFQLSFDFHYNKQASQEHLRVAYEFLNISNYALGHDMIFAFIDNSFSAVELLAKVNLLLEANKDVSSKTTHKAIKSAYNLRYKNAVSEFDKQKREIFNRLSDVRDKARYLNGALNVSSAELKLINETISQMFNELCNRAGYSIK
jgi:hypothetical protein